MFELNVGKIHFQTRQCQPSSAGGAKASLEQMNLLNTNSTYKTMSANLAPSALPACLEENTTLPGPAAALAIPKRGKEALTNGPTVLLVRVRILNWSVNWKPRRMKKKKGNIYFNNC